MANRQRSAEKESVWRRHLEQHAVSGQSIRAYCRDHGVSAPSFYVWRREISRRNQEENSAAGSSQASRSAAPNSDNGGLIAVDVIGQVTSHPSTMEVALTSGVVIRLREDVSAETLKHVLTAAGALERAASSERDAAC